MSWLEEHKVSVTAAPWKVNDLLSISENISDEVLELLQHIENAKEIKDEFLSEKLTEIFNTKYLDKLFEKLIELQSQIVDSLSAMGILILSEDEINRRLEIRKIVSNNRFIINLDTENSISNISIWIIDLSIDVDNELFFLAEESVKYIWKSNFYLDDFMTREEWLKLRTDILNEDWVLIKDEESFWRE